MANSALASVLHNIRRLAESGDSRQSDRQLLEHFLADRDEAAFALLIRRHGKLVLSACRRVLADPADVEDAFQATFLVLLRRASSVRWRESISSWLFGVAHRIAVRARANAQRRQRREGEASRERPRAEEPADLSWHEGIGLLHEELDRLPDRYRLPLLLCYLDGKTRDEAATVLGCSLGALRGRLARGREMLRLRLLRRGLTRSGALLAALVDAPAATSAPPPSLIQSTLQAAVTDTYRHSVAALVRGAMPILFRCKVRIAVSVVLMVGLLAVGGGRAFAPPQTAPSPPAPAAPAAKEPARPAPEKTVVVCGRVLDPDGKPAAGAKVYVDPVAEKQGAILSTTTAKDGRFSLTLARSHLLEPETKFPLRRVRLVATAKGWGLDWLEVPLDDAGKEATLRLVKDDVPIQGRILSLEGKPLAGIKVSVQAIEAFPKGDLSRALDAYRKGNQISDRTEVRVLWYPHHAPAPSLTATTGADGRVRLDGLGRERIVTLAVEGPGIHYSSMQAMTRRAASVRGPYKTNILYGAAFEYLAQPSRLIRGTVREKGTGKPLANIRIHDMGFTGYVMADATTDEQGRYELPGCPKGNRYGLSASPIHGQPYLLSSIGLKDTEGLGPLTADLEMVRGIPCEGKVLDGETGQAVPGDISYYPLYPNPNVTSSIGLGNALRDSGVASYAPFSQAKIQADGSFRCAVLPGGGCLAFRAREANRYLLACVDPSTSTVKMRGNKRALMALCGEDMPFLLHQEQFQAIRLIEPAKDTKKVSEVIRVAVARLVIGAVLDAEGKPLTGVRVRGLERWEWKTLATEKFTVHGVNPLRPRRLYFVHEAKHLIATVEVKGTETKPLPVRLQPWAAVRGRLLDADGRPLRNVKLQANEFLPENGWTDDEGRFRLEGLIPGRRYDLTYAKDKPSAVGTLIERLVGKPGEVRDLGDVRGKPFKQE